MRVSSLKGSDIKCGVSGGMHKVSSDGREGQHRLPGGGRVMASNTVRFYSLGGRETHFGGSGGQHSVPSDGGGGSTRSLMLEEGEHSQRFPVWQKVQGVGERQSKLISQNKRNKRRKLK